ncbi:MAG: hypothetical protein GY803_19895 [Chloroflexi bacterium]|nr:hypothetical protein [Chloroflexota bacterium]
MINWRERFTPEELAEIDKAYPQSVTARMAQLLDLAYGSDKPAPTAVELHHVHGRVAKSGRNIMVLDE